MPAWLIAPVEDEPETSLAQWQVMELPNGDRHFVGYAVEDREGRASSAVVVLDTATMSGVTTSGRIYRLQGRPGYHADAEYTWRRWARINGASDWKDVSAEVWAMRSEAHPAREPAS